MALRFLGKTLPRFVKPNLRGVMTTELDLNNIQEELKNNPYYDKYAEKIEALKKQKPEEFHSKMKEFEEKKKPKGKKEEKKKSYKTPMASNLSSNKTLGDIMKLELIKNKTAEEVTHIWHEFHRRLDCISNVLSGDIFRVMEANTVDYPTFIVPVPRQKGYEFMMVFFDGHEAHFTPLSKYQELKENAPECLCIKYYKELLNTKNLVLMRGFYDKNIISNLEANCLSSSLQLYYGDPTGKRTKLLEMFNHEPEKFQHMDLIEDFECYSRSSQF